jgi:hypothetical protein
MKITELLLEVVAKQEEQSQDIRNLSTARDGEPSHQPPNQPTETRPAPAVNPNPAANPGISFSNGSGNMLNFNSGNTSFSTVSGSGNNNSINYYG